MAFLFQDISRPYPIHTLYHQAPPGILILSSYSLLQLRVVASAVTVTVAIVAVAVGSRLDSVLVATPTNLSFDYQ